NSNLKKKKMLWLQCFSVLCVLGGVRLALVVPPLDTVVDIILLKTEELIATEGNVLSYRYFFPDSYLRRVNGTNVNVFGVSSNGWVALYLHDTTGRYQDVELILGKTSLGNVKCSARFLKESFKSVEKPCDALLPGRYTWFTLERTNSYLAIYRQGRYAPDIELSNLNMDRHINFNTYNKYSVASQNAALWDFLGYRLNESDMTNTEEVNPFVYLGLKPLKDNHKNLQRYVDRCEFAKLEKNTKLSQYKLTKLNYYIYQYCNPRKTLRFNEAFRRHQAALRVNNIDVPVPGGEAKTFFENEFY
ncbi:hypothetical protein OTU49_001718, partial [Cherax quadricarinatus]